MDVLKEKKTEPVDDDNLEVACDMKEHASELQTLNC